MNFPKIFFSVVAAAVATVPAGGLLADADADLDAIRSATAKYRDVNVALADGYVPDPTGNCVTAALEGLPPELGAMGIHYLNPGLLGLQSGTARVMGAGLNEDFTRPSILIYEPQEGGALELVGIENLIFQKPWADAGRQELPVFAGQPWDRMADDPATPGDDAHGFEPHYDLHLWTERENPAGLTVAFNPAVRCPQ